MRFAGSRFTNQNQWLGLLNVTAFCQLMDSRGRDLRSLTEVKLLNGLKKRKVRFAGKALQSGLLAMRDFFCQQNSQEVTIAPLFSLSSIRYLLVNTTCIGQIQSSEKRLQLAF